jgi:hypothetical protein
MPGRQKDSAGQRALALAVLGRLLARMRTPPCRERTRKRTSQSNEDRMTLRWTRPLLPLALALTAGCAGQAALAPVAAPALLPDYRSALEADAADAATFLREWLAPRLPEEDENGLIAFAVEGSQGDVMRAVERLLAGYEAYCAKRGGSLTRAEDSPGQRCMGADGAAVARLEIDVVHAAEFQPAQLRFAAESGERMQRLAAQRRAQYSRVVQALEGNGPAGNVLLATGEAFDVTRFGRLSGPDYYAIRVAGRDPISLAETLSVRWNAEGLRVALRDGSVVTESGAAGTPARSLVRLVPSDGDSVEVVSMSFEAPFRFVTPEARSKLHRQVRVRNVSQLLEITVSPRPPAMAAVPLAARADPKEQAAFNRTLVSDATKAAKKLNVAPQRVDLTDERVREEVERMGRNGPCSRSQSDVALKTGDLSLSEFYVCAQYRKEAKLLLGNDGVISAEKTPLVFLGRAARAPWFDFGGVLR